LARQMTAENIDCGCGDIEAHSLDEVDRLLREARVLINATTVECAACLKDRRS